MQHGLGHEVVPVDPTVDDEAAVADCRVAAGLGELLRHLSASPFLDPSAPVPTMRSNEPERGVVMEAWPEVIRWSWRERAQSGLR